MKSVTDSTPYSNLISQNDCVVSPIIESAVQNESHAGNDKQYQLEIPHNISDVDKARKHIRVRRDNGPPLSYKEAQEKDFTFEVGERHVDVKTRKLGRFIVTAEGLNCCGSSVNILVYGKLESVPQQPKLVSIKTFFGSVLHKIKDYESVSRKYLRH